MDEDFALLRDVAFNITSPTYVGNVIRREIGGRVYTALSDYNDINEAKHIAKTIRKHVNGGMITRINFGARVTKSQTPGRYTLWVVRE